MTRNKTLRYIIIGILLIVLAILLVIFSRPQSIADEVNDEGKEPQETDDIVGSTAVDNGVPLPAELFGTWSAVSGLPPELSSYTITINADGSAQDTSVDTAGTASNNNYRCVSTDNGYAITNENGITLLTLRLENGQLISDNFSSQPVVFSKVA